MGGMRPIAVRRLLLSAGRAASPSASCLGVQGRPQGRPHMYESRRGSLRHRQNLPFMALVLAACAEGGARRGRDCRQTYRQPLRPTARCWPEPATRARAEHLSPVRFGNAQFIMYELSKRGFKGKGLQAGC